MQIFRETKCGAILPCSARLQVSIIVVLFPKRYLSGNKYQLEKSMRLGESNDLTQQLRMCIISTFAIYRSCSTERAQSPNKGNGQNAFGNTIMKKSDLIQTLLLVRTQLQAASDKLVSGDSANVNLQNAISGIDDLIEHTKGVKLTPKFLDEASGWIRFLLDHCS